MPLKLKIGRPIDGSAPGKLMKIIGNTTMLPPGEYQPVNSTVNPDSPEGASVKWERTPIVPPGPTIRNTSLVLHHDGDHNEMLNKLSTTGLEVRRGNVQTTIDWSPGDVEGVILTYPFRHSPTTRGQPVDFAVIESTRNDPVTLTELEDIKENLKQYHDQHDHSVHGIAETSWCSVYATPIEILRNVTSADGAPFPPNPTLPSVLPWDQPEKPNIVRNYWFSIPMNGPTVAASNGRLFKLPPLSIKFCDHEYYLGGEGAYGKRYNEMGTLSQPLGGFPHFLTAYRVVPGGKPVEWNLKWAFYNSLNHVTRYYGVDSENGSFRIRALSIDNLGNDLTDGLEIIDLGGGNDTFVQVELPNLLTTDRSPTHFEGRTTLVDPVTGMPIMGPPTMSNPYSIPIITQDAGSKLPLPIFAFFGDDIAIVYSPPMYIRTQRDKLNGTLAAGFGRQSTLVPDVEAVPTVLDIGVRDNGRTFVSMGYRKEAPGNKEWQESQWWLTPKEGLLFANCNDLYGFGINFSMTYLWTGWYSKIHHFYI